MLKSMFPRPVRIVISRPYTTGNDVVNTSVYNRNPRNLERMRISYKPSGFHLEVPGSEFWHKLVLEQKSRRVSAHVIHNSGIVVVTASTSEWAITQYLYRSTDTAAYLNLAHVFAERCLESGISKMQCDLKREQGRKITDFLNELEKCGLSLEEPPRFLPWHPWHEDRPEKPWEVFE